MKRIYSLVVVFLLILNFPAKAIAQAASGSNASATILSPVLFSISEDIAFEELSISNPSPDEVFINRGGSAFQSLFIPRINSFETSKKGVFKINSSAFELYDISIPSIVTLYHNHTESKETILAETFITENSSDKSKIHGEYQIQLDAKVYFDQNQLEGNYISRNFFITLNLN